MAWNDIARHDHRRVCARYPSDITDREWAIIAPLLPPARPGGRPRTVDLRAVMEGLMVWTPPDGPCVPEWGC
jgi:putative transposase